MYEVLSSDELLYHQRVSDKLSDAQAAHKSWVEHLVTKYQLKEKDVIMLDGRIKRFTDLPGSLPSQLS